MRVILSVRVSHKGPSRRSCGDWLLNMKIVYERHVCLDDLVSDPTPSRQTNMSERSIKTRCNFELLVTEVLQERNP